MKSSGFKRPILKLPKQIDGYTPRPRAIAVSMVDHSARMVVQVRKEVIERDDDYRRLVSALPCAWCKVHGYSQVAHGNQNKGMGMKTSDATCFPACGPRPLQKGCHALLDQSNGLTKAHRRELEELFANRTRMTLRELALHDASARVIVERVIGL